VKIDREQWARLSALLDDALDLDVSQRDTWLNSLSGADAAHTPRLRVLLAQRAQLETDDFLKAPDFAAAFRAESARRETGAVDLQAGALLGGYRLLRELGRGGMGSVWLGERIDGRLRRQVALKFPYSGPHQRQLAERMARERDILARLEHPNIARLYDADVTANGQPFLVLEYVDGIAIDAYCDHHLMTLRERCVLFLQVLSALQYAHSHLIIHRDLKPSNILVTRERIVRLLDFGIAKLISEEEAAQTALTQFGGRALTPDYASPEQIGGQSITTASDVYALGVVLYELLAGARPYRLRRENRASLEDAIAEANVIAPSRAPFSSIIAEQRSMSVRKLSHTLRGDLDAIIQKALQKNPAHRYASVDALAQDLKHWLDGEVIEAKPPSPWDGMRKLINRNRLLFGAVTAVFVSLIAGAALAIWQARSATAQAQRLEATKAFLLDIFNSNSTDQPDPLKAQQTTARELLDRAAQRVTAPDLKSSDAAEEVLGILGSLYQDLGLDDKSAELRKRRVAMLITLYGKDDVRTAEGEIVYARSLYATDDWKQALAPLEDAERILDQHGDHSSYTRALQLGAMAEYLRGSDRTRAREYSRRALALTRQSYPTSPAFIEELRGAAMLDSETGNRAAAIPLLEEALAVQQATDAAEIRLIRPLVELAELQAQQPGMLEAAEQSFKRGLEISRRINGDLSVDTIQAGLRYGKFLRGEGRLADSEQLLKDAEANALKLLGSDESFHLPTVRDELAQTEHALGNFAAAAQLYRQAIATREAKRSGNRQHANMLQHYAALLTDMGRADQSLDLVSRAIDYYQNSQVPVGTSEVPVVMSAALSALGRSTEALDALDRFTSDQASLPFAMQIEIELRRAAVLRELGESQHAESLLRQQLKRLGEQPYPERKRLLAADGQVLLGRLLLERGGTDEAHELLATALHSRQTDLAADSPLLAEAQAALGDCLARQGDLSEARLLLHRAQSIDAASAQLSEQYRGPVKDLAIRLSASRCAAATSRCT
jgi:serine/threonine protein kinase